MFLQWQAREASDKGFPFCLLFKKKTVKCIVVKKDRCAIIKGKRKGNGMKDTNIQWHPAFVSAIQLEFKEDREKLLFEKEHNLNTKPLQIDLLVIRKEETGDIGNEIGKIFRKFNILEYKSPRQQLDVDIFYKSAAYACLYKSYGRTVDERKAEDITVSIVRDGKPEKLFQYFEEHGIRIDTPCQGIYYVLDKVLFPTQIIVAKELNGEQHTWLKSLTDKMEENDMRKLLKDVSHLSEKLDKEFADSVLEVCLKANEHLIKKLKGDDTMSEALLEIVEPIIAERMETIIAERMKPIIAERERMLEIQIRKETKEEMAKTKEEVAKAKEKVAKAKEEVEKEKEKGIKGMVEILRDLGNDDNIISAALKKQYHLSEEEISQYL